MKKINSKAKIVSLGIILVLTLLSGLPLTFAHTPAWQIPVTAKVEVSANPVGVNQMTLIYMWLGYSPFPDAALVNDYRFHNYALHITEPDGNVISEFWETIVDTTNSQFYRFTPTKVGTYTIDFTFTGFNFNDVSHNPSSPYVNDTYLPSSASITLTVQEEPLPDAIYSYPLPTEYWTRPIYGENTDWWSISSNWLGSSAPGYSGMVGPGMQRTQYDAVGPLTNHIMWTKPLQSGGVVGGDNFIIKGNTYFEGSAYIQRFTNPIIVNGRLYYKEPLSWQPEDGPTNCVDLRTGDLIWSRMDVPALSFAYIYDVEDPQQHGVYPAILFTSNFGRAFDADTGNALFNVTNVPSGSSVLGPQGEILRYVIRNDGTSADPDYQLAQWNSSLLWTGTGFSGGLSNAWRPTISGTVDAGISSGPDSRYNWNVSLPWLNEMSSSPRARAAFYNDIMVLSNGSQSVSSQGVILPYGYFAINLNASRTDYDVGEIIWSNTISPPSNILQIAWGGADPDSRVFVENYRTTQNWMGYDLDTGEELWGPTTPQEDFDFYGSPGPGTLANAMAYGKMYSSAYAGILYCYDLRTGNLEWTYGNDGEGNSTNSGFNCYYGNYPTFINAIANGVVYLVTTEHTVETPIYKGAKVRAVNATDGTEIWTLSDYTGEFAAISFAIADGFATYFNGYDNQVYSIGRGPSQTTVEAPDISVSLGTYAVIKGSVMDISAGTKQNEQAARFPKGVPAISDASMEDWMGYVYQQKPRPQDAVGVEVRIQTLDPDGNYAWIGTTTTDSYGNYAYSFIPQKEGMYAIIASFVGSNGYWGSETTTYLMVGPAPAQVTIPSYPGYQGPSAQEVANNVVNSLPDNPTTSQIAQAVVNAMPEYPEQQEVTIPEYTTIDIILIILVAIAIIIGLVCIIMLRKK